MLDALEAIPFPEGDRRESERLLRDLARGVPVPKLHTRSLPAVAAAPTLPLGALAVRRHWWRSPAWISGLAAASVLTVGLALWGALRGPGPSPELPRLAPLQARPPAAAVPAATGKLRLLTAPPDAEILIDGRRFVGSVVDLKLAPGPRRLQIRAPGYQVFDTTIVVTVGQTLSLGRIALRSRESSGP
jgi:hypothetical protein